MIFQVCIFLRLTSLSFFFTSVWCERKIKPTEDEHDEAHEDDEAGDDDEVDAKKKKDETKKRKRTREPKTEKKNKIKGKKTEILLVLSRD